MYNYVAETETGKSRRRPNDYRMRQVPLRTETPSTTTCMYHYRRRRTVNENANVYDYRRPGNDGFARYLSETKRVPLRQ